VFLQTLEEGCGKTFWQVHAYCLVKNHFHLVAYSGPNRTANPISFGHRFQFISDSFPVARNGVRNGLDYSQPHIGYSQAELERRWISWHHRPFSPRKRLTMSRQPKSMRQIKEILRLKSNTSSRCGRLPAVAGLPPARWAIISSAPRRPASPGPSQRSSLMSKFWNVF
jgi:hypothetical protein